MTREPLTYRGAGVDIQAGNEAVRRIARIVDATRRPEVLGGIGAFAAFCRIPAGDTEPVLVSSTDTMGIGDLVVVAAADAARRGAGERVVEGGEIRSGPREVCHV